MRNKYAYLTIFLFFQCVEIYQCTHLKGTFNSKDFFTFLIKFGFQKTDGHSPDTSHGYIFGNITSNHHFPVPVTFAVLDRSYFLDYYKNRVIYDKDEACKRMFSKLNKRAYDSHCSYDGRDYLRRIPCPKGQLCVDEDNILNVVKNHQFTYVIQDFKQPSFWYVSMVACYHNTTTCEWHYYDTHTPYNIDYDIWLVNGNPNNSAFSTYQFSFDRQNTLELYMVFWLCYMVLVPLQCHAVKIQKHPVTRLFTASLLLDFVALCFNLIHTLKFALNGEGFPKIQMIGDICDILSRTSFMLLLLLLAKGWAVTRLELSWKPLVFAIWLCYGIVHILLYVWNLEQENNNMYTYLYLIGKKTLIDIFNNGKSTPEEIEKAGESYELGLYKLQPSEGSLVIKYTLVLTEVDIIEDIDEYQTWPGWLIIVFRSLIMCWFLYELRTTMLYEHNTQKLNFLLHFGASSLVWFIYLPILALIALHVSALWRFKLLLGITYSADCFAYCVMAHLLWPTRSEQYFLLKGPSSADLEELDEFNEAPHIVNNSYTSLSSVGSMDIGRYEDQCKNKTVDA